MKKIKLLSFLLIFSVSSVKAQLQFSFNVDGGFAGSTIKTDELPVFLSSYNSFNAGGLSKPFEMKQGLAKGHYFNFDIGIGGSSSKFTVGFARYLVETPANEARFSNGEGRDISVELKDASTECGYRFDSKHFTAGFQFDMIIRTVTVYSRYVFQDGSKSISNEHPLNGAYSNSRLQVGCGANIGFRVLSHLYIIGKGEYVFQTDKKHPEYHQYNDLTPFSANGYLPRDMNEYTNNSWNISGNSISNDIRGLRFSIGIQIMFSTANVE